MLARPRGISATDDVWIMHSYSERLGVLTGVYTEHTLEG